MSQYHNNFRLVVATADSDMTDPTDRLYSAIYDLSDSDQNQLRAPRTSTLSSSSAKFRSSAIPTDPDASFALSEIRSQKFPRAHGTSMSALLACLATVMIFIAVCFGLLGYALYHLPEHRLGEKGHLREVRSIRGNGGVAKRQSVVAERRLPEAIIIGVKKGGTRALLEFLRIHPNVRAPGPEIHFFDRHYHRGFEWYRRQMPTTTPGQLTIEKTPSYFVTKDVPKRMAQMNPAVKILLVVRDPVTRAISDYAQNAAKRFGMASFASLAFTNSSAAAAPSEVNEKWGAIRLGVYWRFLARWLEYFPLSQIHVVNGERLIHRPAAEMAGVEAFLGLPNIITPTHFYFNSTKGFPCLRNRVKLHEHVPSATEHNVLSTSSVRNNMQHSSGQTDISKATSNGHTGSGHNTVERHNCLGKTKGRTHPVIEPLLLDKLRQFFRPHNEIFEKLTGRRFHWS